MSIDHLLGLYLNGQASEQQAAVVEKWISESSDNQMVFQQLQRVWHSRPTESLFFNSPKVEDHVWQRLHKSSMIKTSWFSIRPLLRVAAAIITFLAVGVVIYFLSSPASVVPSKDPVIVKANPAGVKSTLRLPDGSTVVLNAESTIRFAFSEADTIRQVLLDGEAYFKVQPDQARPFVVVAGRMRTEALGTSFNVRAYSSEQHCSVALEEGLVKIKVDDASHTGLLLQPGELARYDATSGETTTEHFDMRELLSWKEGILYFNKSSLQEVTSRLSRWYDVDFQLINYNGQPWYYSGEFRQDEYLDIILESMSYSKHFRFDITQDTVRMYFDESNKAFSQ